MGVLRRQGLSPDGRRRRRSRGAADDRDRDAMARRFIASMETMAYARAVSLETTAGDVHKTTTSNAVGNATINAATPAWQASTCG